MLHCKIWIVLSFQNMEIDFPFVSYSLKNKEIYFSRQFLVRKISKFFTMEWNPWCKCEWKQLKLSTRLFLISDFFPLVYGVTFRLVFHPHFLVRIIIIPCLQISLYWLDLFGTANKQHGSQRKKQTNKSSHKINKMKDKSKINKKRFSKF